MFRYIEGVVSPPSMAAASGKAVHSSHEQYFRDILEGCSSRMTPAMVEELAQVSLEEVTAEDGLLLDGDTKDEAMKEVGIAAKTFVELAGQYIDPITVEEEIRYTSRCGVDILGYSDLIRRPLEAEAAFNEKVASEDQVVAVIADYKLTGKKWNLNQVKDSLQFQIYALALDIPHVEIQNLVRTTGKVKHLPDKGDPPDFYESRAIDKASNFRILRHRFDGSDFDHVENLIEAVATAISSGIFIPCNLDSWCCNDKWCGYWHLCRGQGRSSPQIFDMAASQ